MADQLAQLKQKYQPVLDTIQSEGAQLQNVNMDGNQLYVKATAKSEESKNRIWDAIKKVDPAYSDLKHDIEVSQQQQNSSSQGAQKHTVRGGDLVENQRASLRRRQEVYDDRESQQPGRSRQGEGGSRVVNSSSVNPLGH